MIIEIPKIRPEGEWFDGDEPASVLDLDRDPSFQLSEPIHYHFFVQPMADRVIVKGALHLPLRMQCGKCTDFFSTTVEENSFLRAYEISASTETLDLTPDIREDILLQMPHYPTCSPDCKGLCPQCGINWNREGCTCRPPDDNRWSALDQVKLG